MLELLLLALFFVGWTALIALSVFVIALIYGRWYWNGAERTGSQWRPGVRRWGVWRRVHRFFGLTVNTHEKARDVFETPTRKTRVLMVMYPHGFIPLVGWSLAMHGDDPLIKQFTQRMIMGAASFPLFVPILRELMLAMGFIDVSRESLQAYSQMNPEMDLGIAPGGMREMVRARHGSDDIYLPHRGFLRLARELGFDLIVPVYIERQTDIFFCSSRLRGLRDWVLSHFWIPLPMLVVPIPLPVTTTVHVGCPVIVGKNQEREFTDSLLAMCKQAREPWRVKLWMTRDRCVDLPEASRSDVLACFSGTTRTADMRTGNPKEQ